MTAYIGATEIWGQGNSISLSAGGQVDLFSPNAVNSKMNGDTSHIEIELSSTITPIASDTMVSVNGLLGGVASIRITDKNNRVVKNWTGPQLAAWQWLKTRKADTSPAVAGTVAVSPVWTALVPCSLPASLGPYRITAKGAPFGEIATLISTAVLSLTVKQVFGKAGPVIHEDYIPLANLGAVVNPIETQFPQGLQMQDFAFVLSADSDFTDLTFIKGKNVVYDQESLHYFANAALEGEPVSGPSTDNRPSGLIPIPIRPFARGDGDSIKLSLSNVVTTADPVGTVSLGSAYNPYAILYRELLG